MSGMYIDCGTFKGQESSGSALRGVLDALDGLPAKVVEQMKSSLDEHCYVTISCQQAKKMLPLLRKLRIKLVKQIGHDDWLKARQAEVNLVNRTVKRNKNKKFIAMKYGESPAWQLYCVTDLIKACQVSAKERKDITIMHV